MMYQKIAQIIVNDIKPVTGPIKKIYLRLEEGNLIITLIRLKTRKKNKLSIGLLEVSHTLLNLERELGHKGFYSYNLISISEDILKFKVCFDKDIEEVSNIYNLENNQELFA